MIYEQLKRVWKRPRREGRFEVWCANSKVNSRIIEPRLATVLKLVVPRASIIDKTALFKKGQSRQGSRRTFYSSCVCYYYSPDGSIERYPVLDVMNLYRSSIYKVVSCYYAIVMCCKDHPSNDGVRESTFLLCSVNTTKMNRVIEDVVLLKIVSHYTPGGCTQWYHVQNGILKWINM